MFTHHYRKACSACACLIFATVFCMSVCADITVVAPKKGDTNAQYEISPFSTQEFYMCCAPPNIHTAARAVPFAAAHAAQWARLVDRSATLVACTPLDAAPGARRFAVRYRTAGSAQAETLHLTLSYDAAGLVSSLTFDRPVTHPDGTQFPAGQPIAIEQVMRMAALMRRQQTAATNDLVVTKSQYSFTYKSPHSTDAVARASFSASAPTAFTNFRQISQFVIRAAPPGYERPFVHRFTRYDNYVTSDEGDTYSHTFLPVGGPLDAKPVGLFKARLKNQRILFSYRILLNNAKGELITPDAYELIRSTMATNKPVKVPASGFCEISLDGETHTAPDVPVVMKVGKTSLSGKSVKQPLVE